MRRAFDCCLSSGSAVEQDLLEIRFRELQGVVDAFVVVEADRSHAGAPKPLHLPGALAAGGPLAAWKDRVRLVRLGDLPAGNDPWVRERRQRESIWGGLGDARPDDLVCFSDCDEIPRADVFTRWRPELGVCLAEQQLSYYWLNCRGGGWGGSILGDAARLRTRPLSHWRNHSPDKALLPGGGWHFSFLGGVEAVRAKLRDYAHQDLNLPHYQDERWLRVATAAGIDLFRRGLEYHYGPLDGLPGCVREDSARYAHLWKDAAFGERWISDQQLCWLVDTYRRVIDLEGAVVELGAWEGRSAVALGNMCWPEPLTAVDTWLGSATGNHPAEPGGISIPEGRDVRGRFARNVAALAPNVLPVCGPTHEFLGTLKGPVKFAHIDASHHYDDVSREIRLLLPLVPAGGVLCGDDFQSAGMGRQDLAGGVERAVRELLPGFEQLHNFWIWQRRGSP